MNEAPARIRATVTNLATSGTFATMQGEADLVRIEVKGWSEEHSDVTNQLQRISSVLIDLDGGLLDGHASPNAPAAGWARGVAVVVDYGDNGTIQAPYSYRSAAEVRCQGTEIRSVRETGIHGLVNRYGRLLVELNQNTVVQGAGKNRSAAPDYPGAAAEGAGIHLQSAEGYLALAGRGATISKNWGHGVSLDISALINAASNTIVPWGGYLDLEDCEVSRNGKDGFHLRAGAAGIAGGTWSFRQGSKRILGSPPTIVGLGAPYQIASGQGVVDRCTIHNNGWGPASAPQGHGVVVALDGGGLGAGGEQDCIGAVRFTNTMVWNNAEEGFLFQVANPQAPRRSTLICPVVHCTVAGNGGTARTNLEVVGHDQTLTWYEWQEPDDQGGSLYLNTKLLQSIFERKVDSDLDFGQGMHTANGGGPIYFLDPYPTSTGGNANLVYVRGLRCTEDYGEGWPWAIWWTRNPAPFVGLPPGGLIDWTSSDHTQFYLDPASPNMNEFEDTPFGYGPLAEPPEVYQDIQPIPRPPLVDDPQNPTTSHRDKGAHQTPEP